DVDAMLESMSVIQYREWLAFFKIRNERTEKPETKQPQQDPKQLARSLNQALDGYQQHRDRQKRPQG
ncbi:hypothetical protein LJC24_02160, partial [Desulfococcaceae bacterium OttesenSCG-928-F15]|nr:hypothetical protein [Desulfococcaceae bacterium OttesenSCG-928-F15]